MAISQLIFLNKRSKLYANDTRGKSRQYANLVVNGPAGVYGTYSVLCVSICYIKF